jgi:hypothetical protein
VVIDQVGCVLGPLLVGCLLQWAGLWAVAVGVGLWALVTALACKWLLSSVYSSVPALATTFGGGDGCGGGFCYRSPTKESMNKKHENGFQ